MRTLSNSLTGHLRKPARFDEDATNLETGPFQDGNVPGEFYRYIQRLVRTYQELARGRILLEELLLQQQRAQFGVEIRHVKENSI